MAEVGYINECVEKIINQREKGKILLVECIPRKLNSDLAENLHLTLDSFELKKEKPSMYINFHELVRRINLPCDDSFAFSRDTLLSNPYGAYQNIVVSNVNFTDFEPYDLISTFVSLSNYAIDSYPGEKKHIDIILMARPEDLIYVVKNGFVKYEQGTCSIVDAQIPPETPSVFNTFEEKWNHVFFKHDKLYSSKESPFVLEGANPELRKKLEKKL